MKARLLTALIAVAALATGCAPPPGPAVAPVVLTASAETVDALVDCPELPGLPTARCGSIAVPRDRDAPANGTIDVGFALVPHTDTTRPGLGTIVPNPGGPGGSTIDLAGTLFTEALAPLLDRYDVLLIDTRGVGRSSALQCPALDGPARVFASRQRQRELIGRCGEQLGDKIGDYSTNAVADDIDTVRATLGLSRLDLLGVSYGTYLMAAYAQRHPEHVRSISLAGAYAVNVDTTGEVGAAAFRRAMRLVCDRTGECDGDRVLTDLAALLKRLRAHPEKLTVDGHRVDLDEWQMTTVAGRIFASRPDSGAALALARAAASARHGDLGPARALVRTSLHASAQIYSYGPLALSDAQAWAVTCHDYPRDFDYADPVGTRVREYDTAQAHLDDADFAPFSAAAWVSRADYDTGACLNWPGDATMTSPFPAGSALPDVPVLVLSGDLDANTPIESGDAAAAQFPHATTRVIEGAGHTPASTPEGAAAIVEFIRGI
ncbi:esterase [Actinoplanes philippinensis]|uniref:Pimeloyl-ACP methyl ester carboxylesterase n=1 Tax=Actinoplanes philippinensis TaxID=35752 RepID=A0A1I2N9I6_9ACTN|nr:alpha/beta fold hydrolase [Actinoplanes philippinensis]GIE76295.1 esterase [Actinoplanes philippinensis]SFF98166.1 Pimeloyl-ACP methyl ester carboxylesterase [Actinoplanes philippinensis]